LLVEEKACPLGAQIRTSQLSAEPNQRLQEKSSQPGNSTQFIQAAKPRPVDPVA
jgi:hypothetical protein